MNNIFSGSFTRDGLIYDYQGIWVPHGATISWKAIVRNADVVCRPSGNLSHGLTADEVLEVIRQLVEASVVETLQSGESATPDAGTTKDT